MIKVRCVFLDRDGVINRKADAHEYVKSPSDLVLFSNVADWIQLFKALGFLVIVVTNQRGVARGLVTLSALAEIHEALLSEFSQMGAYIDDVFVCPHEENSCNCRKPRPGLIYKAQEKWNIDLDSSLMIGDEDSDEELARVCGLQFLRAHEGRLAKPQPMDSRPHVNTSARKHNRT